MRGFSETQCSVPQSLGLEASFGPRILNFDFGGEATDIFFNSPPQSFTG